MSAVIQVNEEAAASDFGGAPAAPAKAKKPMCGNPHPITVFFFLLFKIASFVMYMVMGKFSKNVNYVVSFVVITFTLAFDFWTTKNIAGRLLVGLRWWNDVKPDGSSVWRFECLPDNERVKLNKTETLIFWGGMIISPCIWIICFITGMIFTILPDIKWGILTIIALVLSITNLAGYIKCARGTRKQLRQMVVKAAAQAVINQATGAEPN